MNQAETKILMVVASEGFRDREFFIPAEIFKKAGSKLKVASDDKGTALGDDGGEVKISTELTTADAQNYQALVFIGGPGALKHLNNKASYKLARNFYEQNKPIGAICIAPVILAKAGLLEDEEATVWTAPLDKKGKEQIEAEGAMFRDEKVVQDGNIITASGPKAAEEFGRAIIKEMNAKQETRNKK